MSGIWYDENWGWRRSLTVDNAADNGVRDVEWTPEDDWDDFWANLEDTTNAWDVVIVDPQSGDVLDFHWNGLDVANRAGSVRIDNATIPQSVSHLYVYWSRPSPPDQTTSFVFAEGATAHAVLDVPAAYDLVVSVGAARDEDVPADVLVKRSAEQVHFWLDLSDALRRRRSAHQGSRGFETVQTVTMTIQRNGDDENTMFTVGDLRVADEGRMVRVPVVGGTDDEDYVAIITITTTLGRVLQPHVLVQVRDPAEA